MTIEQEISNLTSATTDLLEAVSISKSALDTSSTAAVQGAATATARAAEAVTAATIATTKASEALASALSAATKIADLPSNRPSIRPSLLLDFANTKQLDPRITFTRASTASFYDGKTVAKAEENLLLWSQLLTNNPWVSSEGSITTTTAVAPDGSNTAASFNENTVNGTHFQSQNYVTAVNTTYAYSVYVKPNGRDFVNISLNSSQANYYLRATFNVATGVLTASNAAGHTLVSTSISDAGNGFFRCTLVFTTAINWISGFCTGISDTGTPTVGATGRVIYTGDGTSGIYIWGAQLEQRNQATAYTPTTTQPITNYIPVMQTSVSGQARFDHNPVTGESLGLLIEEQRTNMVVGSELFSGAGWINGNMTVENNQVISPAGLLNGTKLTVVDGSIGNRIEYAYTAQLRDNFTVSVFAKAGNYPFIKLLSFGRTQRHAGAVFNLQTGTVSGINDVTAKIEAVGNGWYRCSVTPTYTSYNTIWSAAITDYIGVADFTPLGPTGSFVYVWGAHTEYLSGGFITSYIPTTTAQVTRAADSASMTGTNFSSWFNPSEGSFVANSRASKNRTYANVFRASDGSTGNYMAVDNTNNSTARLIVLRDAIVQANISLGEIPADEQQIVSCSYIVNSFAASVNGSLPSTDSSGVVPILNILRIGGAAVSDGIVNSTIQRIAYYPKSLSSVELQGLTS